MSTGGNGAPRTYVYPVFVTVDLRPGAGDARAAIGRALARLPGGRRVEVLDGVPEAEAERIMGQVEALVLPWVGVGEAGAAEELP